MFGVIFLFLGINVIVFVDFVLVFLSNWNVFLIGIFMCFVSNFCVFFLGSKLLKNYCMGWNELLLICFFVFKVICGESGWWCWFVS